MQKLFSFGISSFFIFLLLTVIVSLNYLGPIDGEVTRRLQQTVPPFLDVPLSIFSVLGTAEFASLILLLLIALVPLLRNIFTLVLYVLTGVIELTFKMLIEQVAPPLVLLKTHSFFQFPSSSIPKEFFSYPSGHSARTAYVSFLLIYLILKKTNLNKNIKYLLVTFVLIFDFLMYSSRIYLGEHWLTDVAGGVLLGTFLASILLYLILRLNKVRK